MYVLMMTDYDKYTYVLGVYDSHLKMVDACLTHYKNRLDPTGIYFYEKKQLNEEPMVNTPMELVI